jgi:hypothetical protein
MPEIVRSVLIGSVIGAMAYATASPGVAFVRRTELKPRTTVTLYADQLERPSP